MSFKAKVIFLVVGVCQFYFWQVNAQFLSSKEIEEQKFNHSEIDGADSTTSFSPDLRVFLTNKQELIIGYPISNIFVFEIELEYNENTDILFLSYRSNVEEETYKYYKIEIDFSARTHLKPSQIPQIQQYSYYSYFSKNTFFSFWRFSPEKTKENIHLVSERGHCYLNFHDETRSVFLHLILSKYSQITYQLIFTKENYSSIMEILKASAY